MATRLKYSNSAYDWSALPYDVIQIISTKLLVYPDYVRFRCVCPSWRSSTPKNPIHIRQQTPWLMLPQSCLHSDSRRFFSLDEERLYEFDLPEACYPRRVCGSSQGWLAIVEQSPRIFLINPFTRAIVNLPSLDTFENVINFNFSNMGREYLLRDAENNRYRASLVEMRDNFIKKIVLSDSPTSDFVAVAIIRRKSKLQLAYYKRGQDSWKLIEETLDYAYDVTSSNGLIYSLDELGVIAVSDVGGDSATVDFMASSYLDLSEGGQRIYLVNEMGTILLVVRFIHYESEVVKEKVQWNAKTDRFGVFRYVSDGGEDNIHWESLDNLDDVMLFVGENSSFAFTLSHMPGFRENTICFANDFSYKGRSAFLEENDDEDGEIFPLENFRGDHDVGMFNLEVGFEKLTCSSQDLHVRVPLRSWSHPVWFTPSPFS